MGKRRPKLLQSATYVAKCVGGGGGGGGGAIKSDEEMSNTTNRKALLHVSPLTRER